MCIVIIKPAGKEFMPVSHIKNSCDNNPDGFSMMYNVGGVLRVYRTMDKGKFVKKYEKLSSKLDKDETAMVIHARIGTHGSVNIKNTHCWTNKEKNLGFAHNGILSLKNRDDLTDSETFFRDIFLPIYNATNWNTVEKSIKACIGSSKFAFLDNLGNIHAYGAFSDINGCKYSNTSYIDRVYVSTPASKYSGYYGYTGYYSPYKNYETKESSPTSRFDYFDELEWDWDREYFY